MQLFVDFLTNVDFSYLDTERGVVGETWLASIHLDGPLDEQGMVCDFGEVKKRVRNWLDDEIDHKLVVPAGSAKLTRTKLANDTSIKLELNNGLQVSCTSPNEAFVFAEVDEITADKMSAWCEQQMRALFSEGVENIKVTFSTEKIETAYYHYSHGLKKHAGNCQRIAHGHRSKLEIWRNGELDNALIREWAERFEDIYIGTQEDLIEKSGDYYKFAYEAQQGSFKLTIPKANSYLIETDSTVELIAKHLGDALKSEYPKDQFTVKAYEGFSKGAIYRT